MMENFVNRSEFDQKLKESRVQLNLSWSWKDKAFLNKVIEVLTDPKKTCHHFHESYELLRIGSETHVVLKRQSDDESDSLIYLIPFENYYPKLLEAHVQTGHGGKIKMMNYMKKKWKIPRSACELFVKCCELCNRKSAVPKKSVVVSPAVSKWLNIRGQVELLDYESCPDGDFHWLMSYQDLETNYLYLRPLKSKNAENVALELANIFFAAGAPVVLQSNSGREFVAAVIEKLVALWPQCRIVHGPPRHPQSQGSVNSANEEVEKMMRTWTAQNQSNNWSRGCIDVQWQKNTSNLGIIDQAYAALQGPSRLGLSCIPLPESVLMSLTTEEELEKILSSADVHNEEQPNHSVINEPMDVQDSDPKTLAKPKRTRKSKHKPRIE